MKPPIILAIDTSDIDIALKWIDATHEVVAMYKLGLEFYLNFGREGVSRIIEETGASIFLDLKLHDIPHTVAGASRAVADLKPRFLTVHASGGAAMIKEAVLATPDIDITAVTILTSLSNSDLSVVGFAKPALESAVNLARLSVESGARAIVCSPLEIQGIRAAVGAETTIITPGVRPREHRGGDDQMRTMSPSEAINAGANFVVIGRPITEEWIHGADAMRAKAHLIGQEILERR